MHIDETTWIKNNAKKFADERKISVEDATKRLAQQASKDIDLVWRGVLPDTVDDDAKAFLARAKGETFTNGFGQTQELFSTKDGQFTAAQNGLFETDGAFVNKYVTPDAKRGALDGVKTELGQMALAGYDTLKSDPIGVGKQVGISLAKGAWDAVKHPLDTAEAFIDSTASSVKTFGEGVAVSTNEGIQRQLNSLYGQDVTGAVQIATSAQGAIMLGSAIGAGKAASKAVTVAGDAVKTIGKLERVSVESHDGLGVMIKAEKVAAVDDSKIVGTPLQIFSGKNGADSIKPQLMQFCRRPKVNVRIRLHISRTIL